MFKQSFPARKKILQVIWVNGRFDKKEKEKKNKNKHGEEGMTEAHDLKNLFPGVLYKSFTFAVLKPFKQDSNHNLGFHTTLNN